MSSESKSKSKATMRPFVEHVHPCVCDKKLLDRMSGKKSGKKRSSLGSKQSKKKAQEFLRKTPDSEKTNLDKQKESLSEPTHELIGKDGKAAADEDEENEDDEEVKKRKKKEEFLEKMNPMQSEKVDGIDRCDCVMFTLRNSEALQKVKQGNINWRKDPLIKVKPTKSSALRKENTAYCNVKKVSGAKSGVHALPPPPKG